MNGIPFSLLPSWKLQAVFVDYAETQLETMFGKSFKDMRIFEKVFSVSRLKGRKHQDWAMSGFRTNGVELHIRMEALQSRRPVATNCESLKKAGYKIPFPKDPIDVMTKDRGVYKVSQSRFDNQLITMEEDLVIVAVDPGVSKVISVRETHLQHSTSTADIMANSYCWSITNDEWKLSTRYGLSQKWEKRRRSGSRRYPNVLAALRLTRRKTACITTFLDYVMTYASDLKVLIRELTSRSRRVTRYLSSKNSQRALAKLSWRLCRGDKENKDCHSTAKRIIFYGDGSFRAKKGYPTVPTKGAVRSCCQSTLSFMLQEYGSSKYCPECGCEMKDVHGAYRIRRCTNDPTATDPCHFSCHPIDRDESATVSLTLCASQALLSHKRPDQFCRKILPVDEMAY